MIHITSRDVFLNYVNVLNQANETVAAVIHEGDVSSVDQTIQQLQSTIAPDAKAQELKQHLIDLLVRTKSQPSPGPSPQTGPRQEKLNDKLLEEFVAWNKDYNAWLKTTVQTSNQ